MILALLLAAADPAPMSAIDAERAFAADAKKLGQWTAFRKWSTADALMFVPQPTKAHDFLRDRKDPPVAVFWWPGRSYVSCDGSVAVNTGPWVRGYGKSVGYFTTVWIKQPDGGWKWVYDAGDELKTARAEGGDIKPTFASCKGKPDGGDIWALPKHGEGASRDATLVWAWGVFSEKGERVFSVQLWNGTKYEIVIDDHFVPAK